MSYILWNSLTYFYCYKSLSGHFNKILCLTLFHLFPYLCLFFLIFSLFFLYFSIFILTYILVIPTHLSIPLAPFPPVLSTLPVPYSIYPSLFPPLFKFPSLHIPIINPIYYFLSSVFLVSLLFYPLCVFLCMASMVTTLVMCPNEPPATTDSF